MEDKKYEFNPRRQVIVTNEYFQSKTADWIKSHAVEYWESLDETGKQQFLSVPAYYLSCFASNILDYKWLRKVVVDAVVFFDLYDTWDVYVCPKPSCLRWFRKEELLILHLKDEHFPNMQQINAWPLSQRDLAEEKWCSEALEKMVWEPVDVEAALNMLSRTCLDLCNVSVTDVCAGHDFLCSLQLPLSRDTARSKLLSELRWLFKRLRPGQASFSLLSNGLLRTVVALASKHILVRLPTGANMHFIRVLLSSSPISIRFLDKNSLSTFVQLMHRIHQIVKTTMQSPPKESILNWKMSDMMDAISYDCKNSTFILDQSKASLLCGEIPLWMSSAPIRPPIDQLPVEASEIYDKVESTLNWFINSLQAFNMKLQDQKVLTIEEQENQSLCSSLATSQFLFLQTKEPLFQEDAYHYNLESFSGPSIANSELDDCLQLEPYCLELVQSWCELLCLEPLVCQLCHLDFRMYILPLLRSCFRINMYAGLKLREQKKCPVEVEILSDDYTGNNCTGNDYTDTESDDDYDYDSDSEAKSGSGSEHEFRSEFKPADSNNKGSKEEQFKNSHIEADPELEDESWMDNELLSSLFSSLRERSVLVAKSKSNGGLFFCMELVNLKKFCEQTYPDSEYRIFWEAIARFRLSKTFKYWCCFSCSEIFEYRESFMAHMDFKHQLCISDSEYWLVPASSQDMVNNELEKGQPCVLEETETRKAWLNWCNYCCKKRFAVWSSEIFLMDEPVFEESIHLDNRCKYFLVDAKMQFPNKDQHQSDDHSLFMNIMEDIEDKYNQLRMYFKIKQQLLRECEIIYFENDPEDLDLNNKDNPEDFKKTFKDMKIMISHFKFCPELERVNITIIETLQRIASLKGNLLKFSVGDYRTKLFPYIRCFLNKRFSSYKSILGSDVDVHRMLKEKLVSLGPLDLMYKADHFEVELLSSGNVFISVSQDKSSWGFAYIGIKMKFSGKWSLPDHPMPVQIEGIFKFAGSSNWGPGAGFESQGKLVVNKNEPEECAEINLRILSLETCLHCAFSDKLVKFQEELEKMILM